MVNQLFFMLSLFLLQPICAHEFYIQSDIQHLKPSSFEIKTKLCGALLVGGLAFISGCFSLAAYEALQSTHNTRHVLPPLLLSAIATLGLGITSAHLVDSCIDDLYKD